MLSDKGLSIEYRNIDELKIFFQKCENAILDQKNLYFFDYPKESIRSWNEEKIKEENEPWLKKTSP